MRKDEEGYFYVVDRKKEMIKYKVSTLVSCHNRNRGLMTMEGIPRFVTSLLVNPTSDRKKSLKWVISCSGRA